MSVFDLQESLRRAEKFFRGRVVGRRADAGRTRLAPAVVRKLAAELGGQERPAMKEVMARLRKFCRARGYRCPSRATIYSFMARCPTGRYRAVDLPPELRSALYNLGDDAVVPGRLLVSYALNHGDLRSAMFASGLPWLDLYQAARRRGWRPKSRGLLGAILRSRGI